MAKHSKKTASPQTLDEAESITKGTKKPGQTKEQSKLIAQGIAKGIELYKKQQKSKARDKDKEVKKALKAKQNNAEPELKTPPKKRILSTLLPWFLLVASWGSFTAYVYYN